MSGHTPGEWHVYAQSPAMVYAKGEGGAPVPVADCFHHLRHPAEVRANARLIAGLPKLLEAAKRVHEAFNDHPWQDDKGNRLDALEAAIAEAEARS